MSLLLFSPSIFCLSSFPPTSVLHLSPHFLSQLNHYDLNRSPPSPPNQVLGFYHPLQCSVVCWDVCKCDHPARSQVKIGALFILLGPVILTKKQPRKSRSRAGGTARGGGGEWWGRVEKTWKKLFRTGSHLCDPLSTRTQHTYLRLAPPALSSYHLEIMQTSLIPGTFLLSIYF